MINSGSEVRSHLAAFGCKGQEISRVHLAVIGCNGLNNPSLLVQTTLPWVGTTAMVRGFTLVLA